MKTIKDLSDEELLYGVERCKDRLVWGDYGFMRSKIRVDQALNDYRKELERRGIKQLEFA